MCFNHAIHLCILDAFFKKFVNDNIDIVGNLNESSDEDEFFMSFF